MDAEIEEMMIIDEQERMGDEGDSLSWRINNYETNVHFNNDYNENHRPTHEFLDGLIQNPPEPNHAQLYEDYEIVSKCNIKNIKVYKKKYNYFRTWSPSPKKASNCPRTRRRRRSLRRPRPSSPHCAMS